MAWRVANSLLTLRDQIDRRFPGRNRVSDGYIGDSNHQNTDSDHNPWYGPGIVTAADWTHDPGAGFDIDRFTDELAASRDPRIKYIIANGLILDSRPQFNPWKWMPYTGSNPHRSHVHLSVVASPASDDTRPWNIPMLGGAPNPDPSRPPNVPAWPLPQDHYFGLISGPEQSHGGFYEGERKWVKLIQQALQRKGFAPTDPRWADGLYEQPTADSVAAWQRAHMPGTTRYGEVWSDDWPILLRG
ncbi:hypothetical protein FKR81_32530 [Lentzea tibetensis]|uniref:Peptidoglycan binding-like domain-containing protein n=1 Tax=Lentzea tibetensis TaxID=2591470 RepID=A0A563EKH3_9PSEU|nr:peptidoglycan-binding domain-containing protein [Lentzea tibetensis]TWP47439.1 hypothetical protein FKR81_32530 [Lentzea tibetensis]